jgi:FkbM family methyltransferase
MRTYLHELIRCTRHNLLHLERFRVSYRRKLWFVSDGNVEMCFAYYPYLAFHDIEGYLRGREIQLRSGMTVIDAGGCYGEFALYASKCVGPTGRVLMFEPDPANIEVAKQTFSLNGNPQNVEFIPTGLWSASGTLQFQAGNAAQSAVVAASGAAAAPGTIDIQVMSLPDAVHAYHLSKLDFVKMDIEGAELEVVSALEALPENLRPEYAIASYHMVNGRKAADVLPELFSRIGYQTRTGNPRHLTTWASPAPSATRASAA